MITLRDDDIDVHTKLSNLKKIHELFKKYNTVHAIAVICDKIEKNIEVVNYIKSEPLFEIWAHGWNHVDYRQLDEGSIINHIVKCKLKLLEVFGVVPTHFAPPWNWTSPTLEKVCEKYGMKVSHEKISLLQYLKSSTTDALINIHHWSDECDDLEDALKKSSRKKLRIALVTTNIGDIDNVIPIPAQTVDFDYHCYTEHNLPFPLPNLDNRTQSKYIKLQMQRFLPDYDLYIHLNGRVSVTAPDFIQFVLDNIEQKDMLCCKHYERKTVFEEMEFILTKIKEGNKYLTTRYAHQKMEDELEFYWNDFGFSQKGATDYPLAEVCFLAYWNFDKNRKLMNEWWARSIEFSNFDQCMLSYMQYKFKSNVGYIDFNNEYFKAGKHK